MDKINQLTDVIRNNAECELDYGTLRTLNMIDIEADKLTAELAACKEQLGRVEEGRIEEAIIQAEKKWDEAELQDINGYDLFIATALTEYIKGEKCQ